MSKSFKKTPVQGICSSRAQKHFKQSEHRAERSAVKIKLKMEDYDNLPHPKIYGNEWASPRDGKMWFGNLSDHEDYVKWMRK